MLSFLDFYIYIVEAFAQVYELCLATYIDRIHPAQQQPETSTLTMAPSVISISNDEKVQKSTKNFHDFPSHATTLEYAQSLDAADPLRSFREKFIIPSKANVKATKLEKPGIYSAVTEVT